MAGFEGGSRDAWAPRAILKLPATVWQERIKKTLGFFRDSGLVCFALDRMGVRVVEGSISRLNGPEVFAAADTRGG